MEDRDGEIHADTDEARAGSTPHIVRWILAISLFGAIALLSIIWITGAATRGGDEAEVSVSAQMQDEAEGSSTDSVVTEGFDEIDAPAAGDADPARTIEN